MCANETCLGYLLLFVILFFSLLIFFLLKSRKNVLSNDLKISADHLWEKFKSSFSTNVFNQSDLIFSVWQDKTASMSALLIKNHLNEVVGQIEFPLAAREYRVLIEKQVYKIVVNLTWGGTDLTLYSPNGKELARLKRKSFSPMRHTVIISDLGSLTSKQPILNLIAPIKYTLNEKPYAFTRFISPTRRIGRVGCFSKEVSLPIQIFILGMTS